MLGLLFHDRFYSWDREQYRSKKWPKSFAVFLPYGILILMLTWYATIYHYVDHGWILTVVVSLSGLKLISIVFNWKKSSQAFVSFIENAGWKLWALDIILLPIGLLFILLANYVYL